MSWVTWFGSAKNSRALADSSFIFSNASSMSRSSLPKARAIAIVVRAAMLLRGRAGKAIFPAYSGFQRSSQEVGGSGIWRLSYIRSMQSIIWWTP